MKKIIVVFILLLLSSCFSWGKISTTDEKSIVATEVKSEPINVDVLLQKLDTSISQEDFKKYFTKNENVLVFGGNLYSFPQQEREFIDVFKTYFDKKFLIEKLRTSDTVISSDISKNYRNQARKYLFLNVKKDYLFNLEKFYEMNGVCLLILGELDKFVDTKGEVVKPEGGGVSLQDQLDFYKKELGGILLSSTEMQENKTDYPFIEKKLFTHISHYLDSRNSKYLDVFLNDFEKNLSSDYGYEVYSLFFAVQKEKGKNKQFCDIFNQEYFLWW